MSPPEKADRWRGRKFTAEEEALIRILAPTHSLLQIGELLGRAPTSIQSACRRMKIRTNGGPGGWPMQRRNLPA